MLQALGSTEASAEFIVVALEKGKKEIGLFLLPCCGFFSSPAVSLSAALVHRLQGGPGTFQPFQQGWCFQSAFSEHPQLQPHRAGRTGQSQLGFGTGGIGAQGCTSGCHHGHWDGVPKSAWASPLFISWFYYCIFLFLSWLRSFP